MGNGPSNHPGQRRHGGDFGVTQTPVAVAAPGEGPKGDKNDDRR